MININMNKARDIHREKVREARNPKLAAKDVEFQRALETGADTSAIVAAKNALRDAPAASAIEAASTPDELKQAWDTDLLGDSPYGG
jgi:hypothetical protein